MPSTLSATTAESSLGYSRSLRKLYLIRFLFAAIWVAVTFLSAAGSPEPTPLLTVLLIIYPLFDAGAVLWQVRADPDRTRSKFAEWLNVVISLAIAIALGVTSTITLSAALAVWGAWAIIVGVPQLTAAIRNRGNGGQVAQMVSGGISVFAGAGFLFQGLQGSDAISGVAGYAGLGAIFFLVSAIRLSTKLKRQGV